MKRQWLHDFAKFGAGLVAADFIVLWWLSSLKTIPKVFLGLSISGSTLGTNMVIDFFIFVLLVHYGWNIGKIPQMKERFYLTVAGVIFTVIAVGQLMHVLYQGDISIFGWGVPVLLSWIGLVVAIYLAYASYHFAVRMKK